MDGSAHKTQHWLDVAEVVAAVGSVGGAIAAVVSQQALLASVASLPLSASVVLNLINRQRLLQEPTPAIAAQIQQQSAQPAASPEGQNSSSQAQPVAQFAQPAVQPPTQPTQTELHAAKAHYNEGLALQKAGDMAGAIAAYTLGIEVNPTYAKAHYNRGLAHSQLGNKREALNDFRTAANHFFEQGDIASYQKARDLSKQLHSFEERDLQAAYKIKGDLLFS
ncbi:MAG: tetratricopeptide repeat protein [Aphanocapsa sp. GSE-SYN-MK-11-07L]|nr:tetratricopeptide repeat protein [Aphanocapsa sp. GSE-SYN-MK-11-07L]